MKKGTIYPDAIKTRATEIINALREEGYLEGIDEQRLHVDFCEYFVPKFIAGEILSIEVNEVEYILNTCDTNQMIDDLIAKGFVDSIENEKGEEVIFITQKGRNEIGDNLIIKNDKDEH